MSITDLSIDFQRCLEKFGAPQGGEAAPPLMLDAYRGHLPDTLLQFWAEYGLGVWMKGYFQFCNPDTYKSILKHALGRDSQLKPDRSHVVGFSAFGRLLVWNEDYQKMVIDTLDHRILCHGLFKPVPKGIDGDIGVGMALANVDAETNDPGDQDGNPLFQRALRACGPLSYGQIYALKLHPAVGGPVVLENFAPKDAEVAMTIAAQADSFRLIDSSTPQMRVVRELGG